MLVPLNAKNQVNAVKFIASYLQARYEDPGDSCNEMNFDICEFPEQTVKMCYEEFINKYSLKASGDFAKTLWDLYEDRGYIHMPSYWYHSVKYLFDDYMNGELTIDELAQDVQSRLEIYMSE